MAEISRPETPGAKYLRTHPGAVALSSAPGQLRFRNADGSHATMLGSLTHRDSQNGAWIAHTPVLSTTQNGWRIDGALNNVFIRKVANSRHSITQIFTDFDTKHSSVLVLTVPTMAYGQDMNFQFNQNGFPWNVRFDQTGAFDLVSTVATKRGPTSYTFDVYSSEALTVNAAGHLMGDSHVNLTRAVIVPRNGARILCSPWTYSAQKGASFTCDDSSLDPSQFPYRIDPSSHSLTDNGTYYVHSSQGDGYNAIVTFNTAGLLPTGAVFLGVGCSMHVVYSNGPDYPDCHTGSFNNPQTVEIGYWVDHGSEEYNDDASVNNVSLTVTSWDPAPLLSPANGATGTSLTPAFSWGGEYCRHGQGSGPWQIVLCREYDGISAIGA